ncbi:MAG: DUF1844 domain-containing protein [Planctomycetota bacterium]
MSDGDQPKIIVDDDWKSQAQKEKQKLAEEEKQRAETAGDAGATGPQGQKLPEASFEELIRTIAMPALMYMGQIPDPSTGKAVVALDLAKLHIDLLGVLEEKTRGNLSDEESTLITGFLGELRGGFVEMNSAIQQAIAEGRIDPKTGQMSPGAGGAPGGAPGMPGAGPLS